MMQKSQTWIWTGFNICLVLLSQCVNGATILEIDLINYENNSGNKADNTACTPDPCDTTFYFCVDLSCGNDSPNSCAYVKDRSTPIAGNSFDFTNNIGGVANPILVPFDDWPGLVLFKVDIYDDNAATLDGWIDQMHEFLEVAPALGQVSAVSEMRLIEGMRSNNPTHLNISFTAYCDTNHYGPQCDVCCADSDDDINGHYTCDPETGDPICRPGWTDPESNCTVNIDDCIDHNCQNFGFCLDLVQGYQCLCLCGTTGLFCETNINDCVSFPCENDGTCVDEINDITCICPEGFTGTFCEVETGTAVPMINEELKGRDEGLKGADEILRPIYP